MSKLTDAEAQAFAELGNYERHYNTIQASIRAVAATWLLTVFGALGFLLRPDKDAVFLVSAPTLAVCVLFAGTVGIGTLWRLDFDVYQRLLGGVFLAGLDLESRTLNLPPLRSIVLMRLRGRGFARWAKEFYVWPVRVLLLLSTVAIAFTYNAMWRRVIQSLESVHVTIVGYPTEVSTGEQFLAWGLFLCQLWLAYSYEKRVGPHARDQAHLVGHGPAEMYDRQRAVHFDAEVPKGIQEHLMTRDDRLREEHARASGTAPHVWPTTASSAIAANRDSQLLREVYFAVVPKPSEHLLQLQAQWCNRLCLYPRTELHVTVGFLGDVPTSDVERLINWLSESAFEEQSEASSLMLTGVGAAIKRPHLLRAEHWTGRVDGGSCPRVAWLSIEPGVYLRSLREQLRRGAKELGLSDEYLSTPYSPHITLGSAGSHDSSVDYRVWDVHGLEKPANVECWKRPVLLDFDIVHLTTRELATKVAATPGSLWRLSTATRGHATE